MTGRRRGRAYGERYLTSGILHCGRCGRALSAHPVSVDSKGRPRSVYLCNKQRRGCGQISANVRRVDAVLEEFVAERLSDPEHASAVSATRARTNERLAGVRGEIEDCESIQQALADRLARREITLAAFDGSNARLVEDLARLTAERDALPGGVDGPVEAIDPDEVRAEWDDADLAGQRGMLARAIGTGQRLYIEPVTPGRKFDPTPGPARQNPAGHRTVVDLAHPRTPCFGGFRVFCGCRSPASLDGVCAGQSREFWSGRSKGNFPDSLASSLSRRARRRMSGWWKTSRG
nr:zinc ribbon domain-containing protein [Amycolatopsis antarctica]